MAIAGYLERVTRFDNKIVVVFWTMTGKYVEEFDDLKSAFQWLEEANLNDSEAVYELEW
ncbi:hypothetical protein [Hippea maritima]|uniref:Uncharacterized protein n=1 Tax=Hippea maritima (strain ATCC 700847 / DSM 10411 / MH2) TaxID=760142 RepID=F2LV41_HIPMA|nr:hypothetical protein [Hippea maritima]AEA33625.1 hypothetical protein Hipma_0655 [Hippea maritima DSM 10411]